MTVTIDHLIPFKPTGSQDRHMPKEETAMNLKVYCNKATKKAHKARRNDACRVSEIKESNLVRFDSLEDAQNAGYKPCLHCYPVDDNRE